MASVKVQLPSLLAPVVGGERSLTVDGASCRDALRRLVRDHPTLATHLFDESGELREHVLCFHNGTNTRWRDADDRPLADGDVLTILQAVSGG